MSSRPPDPPDRPHDPEPSDAPGPHRVPPERAPPERVSPHAVPPEGSSPRAPIVRPFYYPLALGGCLFWVFVIVLFYFLIGWLFAPAWYPWWWR